MAGDEMKKLGPLALQIVDGLRGAALQVVRALPVDELANKEIGVEFLLKSLTRSHQAGAQNVGILSRQRGEPIASYVLMRRMETCMVQDDARLAVARGDLGGAVADECRLLIRKAIKVDMVWDKVCEELVAQHSRIHEKEKGNSFGKGYKSSAFRGYGKGSPSKGVALLLLCSGGLRPAGVMGESFTISWRLWAHHRGPHCVSSHGDCRALCG